MFKNAKQSSYQSPCGGTVLKYGAESRTNNV